MRWLTIVLYLYGLINIGGGIMGFSMAGSTLSLIVGGTVGVLVLILTAMSGSNPGFAYRTLGLLSLVMLGFWIYRTTVVMDEGKSLMMPILNIALSLGVFALLLLSHFSARGKQGSE